MTVVVVPNQLLGRLQPQGYARNGLIAPAVAPAELARAINQTAYLCGKELYSMPGALAVAASAGAGPTTILRSRIHTGPFCRWVRWFISLARPSSGSSGSPHAVLEIQNTSGVVQDSFTVSYGYGTDDGTVNSWGDFDGYLKVGVLPDTDFQLELRVYDNARVADLLVHEVPLVADTANGYVNDQFDASSFIYDAQRSAAQTALYALYRRAGAVVLDWLGSRHTAATEINIIDGTSTTVSASTPGFTLDMRYKPRLKDAATGVNCKLWVRGVTDVGTGGSVRFRDSAGTALATVTGFTTSSSWQSADLVLPATLAKYDITFFFATGITITDVAVFEYET